MDNRDIAVALHQLPGVGSGILSEIDAWIGGDWSRLLEDCSILELFSISDDLLQIMKQYLNVDHIHKVKERLINEGIQVTMLGEEGYPKQLAEIYQPPFLLYGKGDMRLLNEDKAVGIVGTRTPSSYGQMVAHRLSAELAEAGWVIVSGMAKGIDACAHQGALSVKGRTIAVLGSGVDYIYPESNKRLYHEIIQTGLILSEYAPQTLPHKGTFPQRNRIISGLSRGVVIVESHHRSGSLITANWALEQGREVLAVPGSILSAKSAGPHKLIKEGAKLVTSAKDIVDELSYPSESHLYDEQKNEKTPSLLEEEKTLLELISYNQIHIDEIFKSSALPRGEVYKYLHSLEIKNKIIKLPGYFYVKK